ncbi:helix-turn-helix domain-containing protein [Streptomyces sp. NPDC058657]|uniref:helix-turn-helix domain-containing protein n=1 Tax=unclassified Streptomyces TaxID=2593676 RepID=UPI0036528EA0
MDKQDKPRSPREKYGEELKLRRLAAGLTQEALGEMVVCSPTLISHYESGRRLPSAEDARRIDRALGTDGFFERWRENLETKYVQHFDPVVDLEKLATLIRLFALTLVPGILQTPSYARALFRAYRPNHTPEELDEAVVIRTSRAQILHAPRKPVVWALLDEAVIRRKIGGSLVMAEQLHKVADMAEEGRLRLHLLPFGAGAHSLLESLLTLMEFEDSAPVGYVEAVNTGRLLDDPAMVATCRELYSLALSEALPQKESLAVIRAAAEELEHEQH